MARLTEILSQPTHTIIDRLEVISLREWLDNYEDVQRTLARVDVDGFVWMLAGCDLDVVAVDYDVPTEERD